MLPVSGINTDTVRSLAEAWKTNGTPRVQNPEEDKEKHLSKPDLDEYIPEKSRNCPDIFGPMRPRTIRNRVRGQKAPKIRTNHLKKSQRNVSVILTRLTGKSKS